MTVRIGLVGAGFVARRVHLPLLRELDSRFVVTAVADPDAGAREAVARRFGVTPYDDHRALLAAGDLDAVIVCSPNHTHAAIVLAALDAGLHVLVEKPLCLTAEDAAGIVAARDRAGLVVQVGYMKRFDPAYEALLDDLPHGIRHVTTTTHDPGMAALFEPGSTWEPTDVLSDVLLGALIHDVNAVHGVLEALGTPVLGVVDAACSRDGRVATATVALPGDARWTMAWMFLPAVADFREAIAVYADDGIRTLTFPAPYLLGSPATYTARRGCVGRSFAAWDEAYARQLVHFHECVVDGAACRTPPEQARADIELLLRIHEAAR